MQPAVHESLIGSQPPSTKGLLELGGCFPATTLDVLRDDGEHTGHSFAVLCIIRYVCGRTRGSEGYNNLHVSLSWGIVSIQGQKVTCKATSDCKGTNFGQMTAEDCCVNTPNALGFFNGTACSPCIGGCIEFE